jgi:hypothetical protein
MKLDPYYIWVCTGRADPALVPGYRRRREAELRRQNLRVVCVKGAAE